MTNINSPPYAKKLKKPIRPYKLKDPKKFNRLLETRNVAEVAKEMGVSKTTIYTWIDSIEAQKTNEIKVLSNLSYLLLSESVSNLQLAKKVKDSIGEAEILAMKPGQKVDLMDVLHRGAGILFDKFRLQAGLSTANVSNLSTIVSGVHHRLVFPDVQKSKDEKDQTTQIEFLNKSTA